jgi:hypothetical protein
MPSLVYITRIGPPSAELARALESSGFHVKSFGPGEITADECVLIMTSEAVLAGLPLSGLAAITGVEAAKDAASQSRASLQDIQKHLGAESEIWNRIKAAGVTETVVGASTATSQPASVVQPVVPAAESLGFIASQAAMKVLEASPFKAAAGSNHLRLPHLPPHPTAKAITKPDPVAVLPSNKTRSSETGWRGGRRHPRFWQPGAMVAALLIFGVVLLAGRASILRPAADLAAVDNSNPAGRAGTGAAGRLPRGSMRTQSPQIPNQQHASRPSNLAGEDRHHISDYDFVAEDYTTHFDVHGKTLQTPDLRHGAPTRLIPKRIVVD